MGLFEQFLGDCHVARLVTVQHVEYPTESCRAATLLHHIDIAEVLDADVLREDVEVGCSEL